MGKGRGIAIIFAPIPPSILTGQSTRSGLPAFPH